MSRVFLLVFFFNNLKIAVVIESIEGFFSICFAGIELSYFLNSGII